MKAQYAANCEFIQENFEGREAIYIEHGAARVRVTNIQVNAKERYLDIRKRANLPRLPFAGSLRRSWESRRQHLCIFAPCSNGRRSCGHRIISR